MCKQMAKTIGENFNRNREMGFRSKKGGQVKKNNNFKSLKITFKMHWNKL